MLCLACLSQHAYLRCLTQHALSNLNISTDPNKIAQEQQQLAIPISNSSSNKVNDVTVEICIKKSKHVVIIGDSMLNNINGKGLSKSKKVDILNIPGAISGDIVDKIDGVLEGKPESLIVHVGTNDLTNNVNLLNNIKSIVNKVKTTSLDTVLSFSNIIIRRDKRNLEKMRADTNSRLKNFCNQKNIHLILNDNIKENHLGIKKLHLNRKGNSIFAKNLLNIIEGN